jgi:hypothetical protein
VSWSAPSSHDGGRGETPQALESLIDRADVVFCQIDCISHHACLKAKHLCRRVATRLAALLRSELLPSVEAAHRRAP